MNETRRKHFSCTTCGSRNNPVSNGAELLCANCGNPPFAGFTCALVEPPITEGFYCSYCRREVKAEHQLRLSTKDAGDLKPAISWDCAECSQPNYTEDDLEILDDEIIED